MNAMTNVAKPTRSKLSLKPAAGDSPVETPAPASAVPPSSAEPIALRHLRRSTDNIRHTRIDEDVEQLADDIAVHGLLHNLIGYREGDQVMIVGGGRRLQALDVLCNRFAISIEFPVPVLIRNREDAIELSLAENLQQRSMSPVDEFLAFKALSDRGNATPADLAKRFGWKERTVRQRLRLAELAPPVLEALADRAITLDAALAYASSQDRHLQEEVFKAEAKKGWEPHRTGNIRHALQMRGVRTDSPLYRFVGTESYERRGGGYEDDLFIDKDAEKTLANPFMLETAAREMIDFQMLRILPEWQAREDLAPSIEGYLTTADLRLHPYGNGEKVAVPKGWTKVELGYDTKPAWKAIRAGQIPVKVLVGINQNGEIDQWRQTLFVAKGHATKLEPKALGYGHTSQPETPEQRAARERESGILRHARRLAVGPFAGTQWEGRAYWPTGYWYQTEAKTIDGVEGQLVSVQIFVTNDEVKAQRAAGAAAYQAELDARAAEEASA
jgi:ParB/RepB/Spo0J family partition protein